LFNGIDLELQPTGDYPKEKFEIIALKCIAIL
jgi:hypothetical protein